MSAQPISSYRDKALKPPPDQPAGIQSLPKQEADHLEPEERLPFTILAIIQEAQDAFHRSLPQLFKDRPGQWVAFHGRSPVGFAASKTELYQQCLRQGYERGQFLVRNIEPDAGVLMLGPHEAG